jgi:antitoxin ChpS
MTKDTTRKSQQEKPATRKPRYTLAELLEGQEEMVSLSKGAAAWMDAAPVGNEVI